MVKSLDLARLRLLRAFAAALRARNPVALAPTGAEAVAEVSTGRPSLVILDLGIPDMDRIEVCRQLRTWTDTPIIVLTAEGG